MEKLRAKLKKQGGFTLIEMLIVVAIIAILIAISIPLVGSALEKARDATDQANERSAKAAAVLKYLNVENDLTSPGGTGNTGDFYYDNKSGKLVQGDDAKKIVAYGQCKGDSGCYIPAGVTNATPSSNENKIIKVTISENGDVSMEWAGVPS